MEFNQLITTQKGNIAEDLIYEFLKGRNFSIMTNTDPNKSHIVDFIISYENQMFAVEVKAKCGRFAYPDTGFDTDDFKTYKNLLEVNKINVFIFFVDECKERIYGNWISELIKEYKIMHQNKTLTYPLTDGNITYFHVDSMEEKAVIDHDDVFKLKSQTTTNPEYRYKY